MPPLTVTAMREGRVCILAVGGEVDIATAPTLTQQAAAALRQPTERLIIDLSRLEFIDGCASAHWPPRPAPSLLAARSWSAGPAAGSARSWTFSR